MYIMSEKERREIIEREVNTSDPLYGGGDHLLGILSIVGVLYVLAFVILAKM